MLKKRKIDLGERKKILGHKTKWPEEFISQFTYLAETFSSVLQEIFLCLERV